VRRALLAASGLPASVTDDGLSRAVAGRVSMDSGDLDDLLTSSARASRDVNLRPEDARSIVAALQELGARIQSITTRGPRAAASTSRGRGDAVR